MSAKRTPTGIRAVETPAYDLGYSKHLPGSSDLAALTFGDPGLTKLLPNTARNLAVPVMLEMLTDWRIAFLQARVAQPIIGAPYKIVCADPRKQAFFEAMWEPLHRSFMLKAVQAIPMGFVPLIKRWEFTVPAPTEAQRANGIDPWPRSATPYIITGFEQIAPNACEVAIDNDRFAGIRLTKAYTTDGRPKIIPPQFALWMTRGIEDTFGDYRGRGRLAYCYKSWWENMFAMALRLRYLSRWADPPILIGYPPGVETQDDDPTVVTLENKAQAMAVGQAIRGGATVAMPTIPYVDGDGRMTTVQRWTVDVIKPPDQSDIFDRVDDRDTANISLGYLVPPQSYLQSKAGGLVGEGKTVTEVLSDIVQDMSLYEWQTIVDHINEYVFEPVSSFNFPANSPPARLVGTGVGDRPVFNDRDLQGLTDLVSKLAGRGDVDFSWLDTKEAAERLGWPVKEDVPTTEPPPPAEEELARVHHQVAVTMARNGVASMALASESVTAPFENEILLQYDGWYRQTAYDVSAAVVAQSPAAPVPDVVLKSVLVFADWLKGKLDSYGRIYWAMWAGPIDDESASLVAAVIAEHQGYVDTSLAPDLEAATMGALDKTATGDSQDTIMDRILAALNVFRSRVMMYAGFLWVIISLARTWPYRQAGQDPLVRWEGPLDERTCDGCAAQLAAGWRPLSQTPNIGTQNCLTRCRHWIVIKGVDEP